MTKPNPPYRNPLKLPGDEHWEVGFGADKSPHIDEQLPQASDQKVWYVRWGQAISDFFTTLSDRFSGLAQGIRNASDAIVRFFSGRGAESDAKIATKNIKTSVEEAPRAPAIEERGTASPTVYFPIGDESQRDISPPVMGVLGAISSSAHQTEIGVEVRSTDIRASVGRATFEAYRARQAQGQDIREFFGNDECREFAEQIIKTAASIEHRALKPPPELSELKNAAKEFLSARNMHLSLTRMQQEKETREAERLAQAKAVESMKPGQDDFERFVASYVRHRDENLPFIIYQNSKYLGGPCLDYGRSRAAQHTPDEYAALEFLERFHRNPEAARRLLDSVKGFVHLPSLDQPEHASGIASAEVEPTELTEPVIIEVPSAPPPPPAPRWIAVLKGMTPWSKPQLIQISGLFSMNDDDLAKAIEGLRLLAQEASGSSARPSSGSKSLNGVEQTLNYQADAKHRNDELLKSFELARLLIGRLPTIAKHHLEQLELSIFAKLLSVTTDIEKELNKKIGELLPAKKPSGHGSGKRIPPLVNLTGQQAFTGSALFERYVSGYGNLSDRPTYALPEGSAYLKPECLAYAKAFYDDVERMPPGAEVDSMRLMAATYLLSEARKRGYADDPV